MLRDAVAAAGPAADAPELTAAASLLFAENGDADEAADLAVRALRAAHLGGGTAELATLIELSFRMVEPGFFEHALQIADAALSIPTVSNPAGRRQRAVACRTVTGQLRLASQPTSHPGPRCMASVCCGGRALNTTGSSGRYPELRSVRGSTWREHTAKVGSAMTAAAQRGSRPGGAGQLSLVAADFEEFVRYLERSNADPWLATVMAAFTKDAAAGPHHAIGWPPRHRRPCWCGSNERYQNCCAKRADRAVAVQIG